MTGVLHQIEVTVPREKIPQFIKAMEDLGLTFRDTGFIRVTDLDVFITGKQTGIDDDFHPAASLLIDRR